MAGWLISRPKFEPTHLDIVIGFAALAAACVVGSSVRAPFGENENTSARYLAPFRLGHLAILLGIAVVLLLLISLGWERDKVAWLLIRNLLGLSGMAFLVAYVLGGRLSWVLPLGFSLSLRFAGQDPDGKWLWWAWTERPAGDSLSWTIAFLFLVLGLGVVCRFGTRETPGDLE